MVSRSEQIFYSLMALVFLSGYQWILQPYIMSLLPNSGFAEGLVLNVIVWALSYVFVLILIRQVRKSRGGPD